MGCLFLDAASQPWPSKWPSIQFRVFFPVPNWNMICAGMGMLEYPQEWAVLAYETMTSENQWLPLVRSQVSSMWVGYPTQLGLFWGWGCTEQIPNATKVIVQGPSPWPHQKSLRVHVCQRCGWILRLDRNDLHKGFFDYGLDSFGPKPHQGEFLNLSSQGQPFSSGLAGKFHWNSPQRSLIYNVCWILLDSKKRIS